MKKCTLLRHLRRELIPYPKRSLFFFSLLILSFTAQVLNLIIEPEQHITQFIFTTSFWMYLVSVVGLVFTFAVPLVEGYTTLEHMRKHGYIIGFVDNGSVTVIRHKDV